MCQRVAAVNLIRQCKAKASRPQDRHRGGDDLPVERVAQPILGRTRDGDHASLLAARERFVGAQPGELLQAQRLAERKQLEGFALFCAERGGATLDKRHQR